MDSYFGWNNNFAWSREPYENFNAFQENQFFSTYHDPYLHSYPYPYLDPEPQYTQEFSNEEEERLRKTMEDFMQNTNQAIFRLETQVSQLATIVNEFEVNLENHNGCENDEPNNYESTSNHITFNEAVEKVYMPKAPYPERLISKIQPSDFVDQPIEINMIQELSMTQEINENKFMVADDPIGFFLNHLDQNWDELEYLDKVNDILQSTTQDSTKLEYTFEPILSCFEKIREKFLEVNSKHNCEKNSNNFQLPRPPEIHEKFTLTFPFASPFYHHLFINVYNICRYVHLFSFSPRFFLVV